MYFGYVMSLGKCGVDPERQAVTTHRTLGRDLEAAVAAAAFTGASRGGWNV